MDKSRPKSEQARELRAAGTCITEISVFLGMRRQDVRRALLMKPPRTSRHSTDPARFRREPEAQTPVGQAFNGWLLTA